MEAAIGLPGSGYLRSFREGHERRRRRNMPAMRLRLLFYAFASLCLGLTAVATGGFRALAIVAGQADPESFNEPAVIISLVVAGFFLVATATVSGRPPERVDE